MSEYLIYTGSTSDGKIYYQRVCSCGFQNTAGICEHIKDPLVIEQIPGQATLTPTVPHSIGR